MRTVQDTEKRVAMSFEFEDLIKSLRQRKEKSDNMTEQQRMKKLNEILAQSVNSFQLNITGNQSTKYDFIRDELNVTTPSNNIENCSLQILDGINRLKDELDLIESANAVIDIDSENANLLICDLSVKEKNRLTATIGASHDVHSMSQLNGSLSVGVRNVFGRGEKLDLSADLGLGTTNQSSLNHRRRFSNDSSSNDPFNDNDAADQSQQHHNHNNYDGANSIYNIVHNTSNQYSITLMKPRFNIFGDIDNEQNNDNNNQIYAPVPYGRKSSLILKAFQQKLDRTRSSSYRQDSLGFTSSLVSLNKEHCLSYNYHLRSLIPNVNSNGIMMDAVSSPSVADESTMMTTKSSINYRFVRDTRNHCAIPSNGYFASAETEMAGFGGDVDFIKSLTQFYYHWSIPTELRSILNFGFQTGFVMPWKKKLMRAKYGDDHVRIIDRIIPFGGLQLRGFEHAQIGPRDRNDYVHCDFLLSAGISLCVPVFEWLYGNVFVNASHCSLLRNVFSSKDVMRDCVCSAGISAIVPFPVGRLEIGYAHPIKTNDNPFSSWFWAFDVQFF